MTLLEHESGLWGAGAADTDVRLCVGGSFQRSVLESRVLLAEDEDSAWAGFSARKWEDANALPTETAQAANQPLRVVATDLVHAELFGELAGQVYRCNELESVASCERTIGIEAKREIDTLGVLTVALDRTS